METLAKRLSSSYGAEPRKAIWQSCQRDVVCPVFPADPSAILPAQGWVCPVSSGSAAAGCDGARPLPRLVGLLTGPRASHVFPSPPKNLALISMGGILLLGLTQVHLSLDSALLQDLSVPAVKTAVALKKKKS